MRVAWFTPLPPAASGIAAYSVEVSAQLRDAFAIDAYDSASAHDFAWTHRREPYDLVVYQLGNAAWHDYMWAYLARYPGLIVLHDARLHHARARQLLDGGRVDDYRHEFWYDEPHAPRAVVEYAVEGLGGSIYYLWRMAAVAVRTARGVAVHNPRVAADLRDDFADTRIDVIRMGVPPMAIDRDAGAHLRRELGIPADATVFAAFGKVTREKRIAAALRAISTLERDTPGVHLLVIGDTSGYPTLRDEIAAAGIGPRVTIAGAIGDADLPRYLSAADACLCLRWPTAEETSASWLRCLAAARPTVISDLPHLVDVPAIVARGWRRSDPSQSPVAIAVDVVDEDEALATAMRRLANDRALRDELSAAALAYWRAQHRLELMVDDYRTLMRDVATRPAPKPGSLPAHFTEDYSARARAIAATFGVDVDILRDHL